MLDYYFSIRGFAVGYNETPLIRDMEIGISKGEILTLIGPNGAGKSTILKSIIGQLKPIAGAVFLDKMRFDELTEKDKAKYISIVLTEKIGPELLTVRDVVEMGRYPYTGKLGIMEQGDTRIVDDAMKSVNITELANRDFLALSDGQKQRVMLAKAIAQEPDVLVLDEPTAYLDIRYQLEFLELIQKMSREKSLTVIMSLHELDQAEWVSDKVLCVKSDGTLRFGEPGEIFELGYISGLYDIEKNTLKKLGRWRMR